MMRRKEGMSSQEKKSLMMMSLLLLHLERGEVQLNRLVKNKRQQRMLLEGKRTPEKWQEPVDWLELRSVEVLSAEEEEHKEAEVLPEEEVEVDSQDVEEQADSQRL
jgi:hypothetical protein